MSSSEEDTIIKEDEEYVIDIQLMNDMEKVLEIVDLINIRPIITYSLSNSDDLVLETELINDIIGYYLNELTMNIDNSKTYLLNDYFMIKEFTDPLKVKFMQRDLNYRLAFFKKRIIYDLEEAYLLLALD